VSKRVHPPRSNKPSMTQQHHKNDADINTIVERALRSGVLPQSGKQPVYGFMPSETYHELIMLVDAQTQKFRSFPAKIRNRFNNDPRSFLAFLENKENRAEAIELGLIPRPEPEDPKPAPEVPK